MWNGSSCMANGNIYLAMDVLKDFEPPLFRWVSDRDARHPASR
jgi:hypothetical protein